MCFETIFRYVNGFEKNSFGFRRYKIYLFYFFLLNFFKISIKRSFRTHTRDVIVGADTFLEQTISDFPRKDRGAFAFVKGNLAYDFCCGYARLTATDCSGPDGSGLIVPAIIIICGTIRYMLVTHV